MSPADDAGALRVPAAILLSPKHTHIMVVMSVPVFLTAHQCMTPTHWSFIPWLIDGKGGRYTYPDSTLLDGSSIRALGSYLS